MNSLDLLKIAALGLAGVFAWGLVCIAIWGAPKTSKRQAEELAEQAEALRQRKRVAQIEREDAFVAEMEARLPMQRAYIVLLGEQEKTLDNIRKKALAHGLLMDAEKEVFRIKSERARVASYRDAANNACNTSLSGLNSGDYVKLGNHNQQGRA